MPEFHRGGEREAFEEGRKEKNEKYREAWDHLQKVMTDYHANPAQIPLEDLSIYKEAAEYYVSIAEDPGELRVDEKITKLAREILQEAESAGV